MISDNVWKLTHGTDTITSVVAANPEKLPSDVAEHLFKMSPKEGISGVIASVKTSIGGPASDLTRKTAQIDPSQEDLDRTAQCGRFPKRPSDLFLKVRVLFIHPDLIGDSAPLRSIIISFRRWMKIRWLMSLLLLSLAHPESYPSLWSPCQCIFSSFSYNAYRRQRPSFSIKDIMNHYASLIVEAQHEVFLATNYWEHSHASKIITDSLLELSRRVVEQNRKKVVVKLMYDRGSAKQFVDNRQKIPESEWLQDAVQLPKLADIPGLHLEVVNYHK